MLGSPPQAWGRLPRALQAVAQRRFTPTGVGTAVSVPVAPPTTSVHPHRRGDGCVSVKRGMAGYGSPPQAWGRQSEARPCDDPCRFTPTGVGTAASLSSWPRAISVHPHRRGDGTSRNFASLRSDGSPPQAWGRLEWTASRSEADRFTPTGVGTAITACWCCICVTVHPHRRGDGASMSVGSSPNNGSPPQAWGRRLDR